MEIAKMSDNKREQERNELYRTIWTLANELRGSVDGWDFKQYVLGILFYRYISENLTSYINKGEWDAGNNEFDYAKIDDDVAESIRDEMVQEKGFFIKPTELFNNLLLKIRKEDKEVKEKSEKNGKEIEISDLDENLNEKLQEIFKNIEASAIGSPSEENFKGLFDDIDVNSNKLGPTVIKRNKRLKRLITVIGDMDLGNYQDNSIDAFGDTYEYLMGMYASNAGKSGGEFFTPQEVSELLTKISLLDNNGKMKTEVNKVYDPAVGSGSLLLKFAKILGKDNVSVKINAVIYYKVFDASLAVLQVEDFYYATAQLAQTTMRNIVGSVTLDELLCEREKVSSQIKEIIDKETDPWGIKVENVELKDISLTDEMKRVIARAAEAEREKQAVITKSIGEKEAAENLADAARKLAESPGALHLRTLETINDVSSDQSNTIFFPIPMDVLEAVKGYSEKLKKENKK